MINSQALQVLSDNDRSEAVIKLLNIFPSLSLETISVLLNLKKRNCFRNK